MNLDAKHRRLTGQCDQAIVALLRDLKQRGMPDRTLVIWASEFGGRGRWSCQRRATPRRPPAGSGARAALAAPGGTC